MMVSASSDTKRSAQRFLFRLVDSQLVVDTGSFVDIGARVRMVNNREGDVRSEQEV